MGKISGALLDHFFSQELTETKAEEFVNLKQGNMSNNEYALKFTQLSNYSLDFLSNMRSKMRKVVLCLSCNLLLEYNHTMLNEDIDISRLVDYI